MLHEGSRAEEPHFLAVIDVEDDIVLDGVVDQVADHLQADGDTDAIVRGSLSNQDGIYAR